MTGWVPPPTGRKMSARRTTPSSIGTATSQSIRMSSRTLVLVASIVTLPCSHFCKSPAAGADCRRHHRSTAFWVQRRRRPANRPTGGPAFPPACGTKRQADLIGDLPNHVHPRGERHLARLNWHGRDPRHRHRRDRSRNTLFRQTLYSSQGKSGLSCVEIGFVLGILDGLLPCLVEKPLLVGDEESNSLDAV